MLWGDTNDKVSITVDGKRLEITASLESLFVTFVAKSAPLPFGHMECVSIKAISMIAIVK